MMKCFFLSFLLLWSSTAFAADEVRDPHAIYVLADKTKTSTSTMRVFNQASIEKSGALDIKDLLSKVPGVFFQRNGGGGQVTTINMRGTDNRHTLVLIDGVRQEDITSIDGSSRLEFLSLDNIERLEVVKGSQGVLYGASAIGGVINIVTKKSSQSFVTAKVGSFAHRSLSGLMGKKDGKLDYLLDFNIVEEDGFSARQPVEGTAADEDGFQSQQANLKVSYQGKQSELRGWLRVQNNRYDYDSSAGDEFDDQGDYKTREYGAVLSHQFSDQLSFQHLMTLEDYDRSLVGTNNGSQFRFLYIGSRARLEQVATLDHQKGSVVMGWEGNEETAEALDSRLTRERKINRAGLFINSIYNLSFASFSGGLRYERMQNAGGRLTYQMGLLVPLQSFQLRLNHGTGFKAPTLYHYFTSFGANSELEPETSQSFDASLDYSIKDSRISLGYFATDYDQYIDYFNDSNNSSLSRYVNVRGASIKGLELSYEQTLWSRFQLNVAHTFLESFNEETGRYLVRRPRHQSSGELTYQAPGQLEMSVLFEYIGERDAISGILPSFSTWGFVASKRLNERSQVLLRLNNVLDKEYEEIRGFQSPRRNFLVSYQRSL